MILRFYEKTEPQWLLAYFPAIFYFATLYFTARGGLLVESPMVHFLPYSRMPTWYSSIYFPYFSGPAGRWALWICLFASAISLFPKASRKASFALLAINGFAMAAFPLARVDRFYLYPVCAFCLCGLPENPRLKKTWSLEMIRVQFLMIFGAAGIAKIYTAGANWLSAGHLYDLVYTERTTWSAYTGIQIWSGRFSMPPEFYTALAYAVVLIEISCLIAIFYKKLRPLSIFGVVIFFVGQKFSIGWFFAELIPFFVLFAPDFLPEKKINVANYKLN